VIRDVLPFARQREGCTLATDRARLDVAAVHGFLVRHASWARNLSRAWLDRAFPARWGRGLACWLATAIREHPERFPLTSRMLATRGAHAVYTRAGVNPCRIPNTP
jgi:hypothetical protein